jgi:predicted nucleic acid-binding protein
MIHLDTNVLIGALVPGSAADRALQRWLRDGESLAMSAIAWSEFLCGPSDASSRAAMRAAAAQLIGDAIPFDSASADLAADLYNTTGRRRGSHGDCMVAATAIVHGAPLATANVADFERMRDAGLVVLNVSTATR